MAAPFNSSLNVSNVSELFLNSRILYLERRLGVFWGAPYNDLYVEALPKRVPLSGKTIPRFFFFFFFPPLEKKCLEIRKFAKFQSDLLKTNEDVARPQSREILLTFA